LFSFLDINEKIIRNTINNRHKDFEDDLHYNTVIEHLIKYIVTRNKKHFPGAKLKIVDAEEFINNHFIDIEK